MPIQSSIWNRREAENVSCWLCQHFQRYDENAQPTLCQGECRKNPPNRAMDEEIETSSEYNRWGYFTFIFWGNVAWCSGFQASLEENIPASPGSLANNCANSIYDGAILPRDFQAQNTPPWSKRPEQESCWYCNHWQPKYPDQSIQQNDPCAGFCQKDPQWSSSWQTDRFPSITVEEQFPVWTYIQYGPRNWCGKWERNPGEVADPPNFGQGLCVTNPA